MNNVAILELVEGTKTWEDYGRLDLRKLPKHHRLNAPELLEAGETHEDAVRILEAGLQLQGGPQVVFYSPVQEVIIKKEHLPHTVEKRLDARERYALYVKPTIEEPYEIWRVQEDEGFRHRYIAAFVGKHDITVTVKIDPDGDIFWNFMQRDDRKMNKLREGELLHFRPFKEEKE